jgi:hypothetical protein
MAVTQIPDVYAALNLRLRSFSEITALVGSAEGYTPAATIPERARPRVSSVVQPFWLLPHYAILMRKAGGPPPDRSVRIRNTRCDLWFYGPGKNPGTREKTAGDLWRWTKPALCPDNHPATDAFTLAGCRVYGVEDEADPFPFLDRETGWNVMVWPVVISWSEVAAP